MTTNTYKIMLIKSKPNGRAISSHTTSRLEIKLKNNKYLKLFSHSNIDQLIFLVELLDQNHLQSEKLHHNRCTLVKVFNSWMVDLLKARQL